MNMSKVLKTMSKKIVIYPIAFLSSLALHHIAFSLIASNVSVDQPFEMVEDEVVEQEEDKFEVVEDEVDEQGKNKFEDEIDEQKQNKEEKIDELQKEVAVLDPRFNSGKDLREGLKKEVIRVRKESRPPLCAIEKMGMVLLSRAGIGNGSFPSMTINYENPLSYIRAITEKGVRIFVYRDSIKRLLGEIDLVHYSYNPRAQIVHEQVSPIKRVIHDEVLDGRKEQILLRNGELHGDEKLLLIFPKHLEAKYLGHQKWLVENVAKVKFSCVVQVDTWFNTKKKRLFVKRILLKDGTMMEINDPYGI
jgi:hypothetical protein